MDGALSILSALPSLAQPTAPAEVPRLDGGRVRDIVLVRLATAGKAVARADLARELWPIVSHLLPMKDWQLALDRDLGALADAGLCDAKTIAVSVTDAGSKRATLVLGVNVLPRTWAEAKGARLVAKALGLEKLPPRRLKSLMKPDPLRLEIVQAAFKLKGRGVPTASRLRSQLAKLAVARAFDDNLPTGDDERTGLSAKAGRALAGRFAHPPRDFPTDGRLVAALAMESAGCATPGLEVLQTALLRRYVTRGVVKPPEARARPPRRAAKTITSPPATRVPAVQPVLVPMPINSAAQNGAALKRPDFAGFVASVLAAADSVAEGWSGNRKAFVSKVWGAVRLRQPDWLVSEIEFKAMLIEAHRAGRIVLANADLKDQRSMADVQASAIAYKNAIFHFVRVDD